MKNIVRVGMENWDLSYVPAQAVAPRRAAYQNPIMEKPQVNPFVQAILKAIGCAA